MAAGAAVVGYFALEGMAAAVVAGAVNGAIIGAAVGAVTSAVNGTNILEGMGKGALTGAVTGAVAGGVSQAFSASGGGVVPEGTDVSQVSTQTQAGAEVIAPQAGPAAPEGVLAAGDTGLGQVVQPTPAGAVAGAVAPPPAAPPVTDNQYLLAIEKMGKDAFYREAASGAVQAGMGAYASREEAKAQAEVDQAAIEAAKTPGILARTYAAPTVSPQYAAARPTVTAPTALRPTAVQVGVTRPTADIRNITTQQGVLPNA